MRLTSARALKQELVEKVSKEIVEERTYSVRRLAKPVSRSVRQPALAIGVAPTTRRRDFALAVRVFAGSDEAAAPVLRRLKRLDDHGELDLAVGVRYRPRLTLHPGGSCGHYRITAGTLGGFVEDDEYYYILSNNHVLADSDGGFTGDPILQPGPADIKNDNYSMIGLLHRWIPLTSAGKVDAAIARIEADDFYPSWYKGVGSIQSQPVEDRYAVRKVVKKGRTTGITHGRVAAFELDGISIDYGTRRKPKVVTFDDQLEFVGDPDPKVPFSQPGDSGSFIIDSDTMQPYALLYGGGPDYTGIDRTLGQFMPEVLDSLGVWLVQ
jgi:hypothetical protein